jgi:polysaccharide pyruvyl transferase WcaK-like protein
VKLLVTGLCMQGNKGGPAIALALAHAITAVLPDVELVFSVPGGPEDWPHELQWAERYGVRIVRRVDLSHVVPPYCFKRQRWSVFRAWWKELRASDALVQMSALCYFGPPAGPGTLRSVVLSHRVFDFLFSMLARRRMIAWTQSYGPFSTWPVRLLARMDLRRQSVVFCRGESCRSEVEGLLPGVTTMDFPDVAITLPYDRSWGKDYLLKQFAVDPPLVTLSPSAVMYERAGGRGGENGHVLGCKEICRELLRMGFSVLLVPHSLRRSGSAPERCDLAVARAVCDPGADARIRVVDEDLSPSALKSIIANAEAHVGARYHSVIAALSAGVPAVSLSWHGKYRDLMEAYGMEAFVVEEGDPASVPRRVGEMCSQRSDLRHKLGQRQIELQKLVAKNVEMAVRILEER